MGKSAPDCVYITFFVDFQSFCVVCSCCCLLLHALTATHPYSSPHNHHHHISHSNSTNLRKWSFSKWSNWRKCIATTKCRTGWTCPRTCVCVGVFSLTYSLIFLYSGCQMFRYSSNCDFVCTFIGLNVILMILEEGAHISCVVESTWHTCNNGSHLIW